ncbi:DegT/DnrJ/EryC1/StrS aminotransferase family protein [Blastococcus sp. LR1]|uniref:DegT/DnrJ/EryC1/StrS family aminotransferase n=1 Tax=Blastococcus sp. LR1 TaxID=2877000 RepID=UPI001CCEF60A|nr:DegT/DnrJ/EryC1/StrS family aminotransferase [Blastococcus sp. LR1]MCA0144463.1 DegT/DnrJ/EryC1/StrS family aminotransferase [Blastococcus sp. LR1]
MPFNETVREYLLLQSELEAAALRTLRSGWYVHGREHSAFEVELATTVGAAHAVGVASGTDALELALRAVGAGPGAEVVTAGNAGGYAATAALAAGADVVVADVDPGTMLLDPESAAAACTPRTVAVVVTHLYGRAADVTALRAALPDGVAVVEDCAQSIGARTADGSCGSLGDVGTFSFYPTKNLGALGDGGAVTCSSDEFAERLRALRQYGWSERYVIGIPGGRNSRLDELQAALLRVKLPHLAGWNARRREIVAEYARAAEGTELVLHPPAAGDVGHLAVGRHPRRDEFAARLAEAGVATAVHYPVPDHRQPALTVRVGPTGAEAVEQACAEVVSLPCFALLTDAEVEAVCAAVRRCA